MAADLATKPASVCGCNPAAIATSQFRRLRLTRGHAVFDVNDFDETLPAPFEWDLKRLVTSFAAAARARGMPRRRAHASPARGAGLPVNMTTLRRRAADCLADARRCRAGACRPARRKLREREHRRLPRSSTPAGSAIQSWSRSPAAAGAFASVPRCVPARSRATTRTSWRCAVRSDPTKIHHAEEPGLLLRSLPAGRCRLQGGGVGMSHVLRDRAAGTPDMRVLVQIKEARPRCCAVCGASIYLNQGSAWWSAADHADHARSVHGVAMDRRRPALLCAPVRDGRWR